jgi:hypothetical protein
MTTEELLKKIESVVLRVQDGQNPEDDRVELKSQWYLFRDSTGNDARSQNEFLKDLVALASAQGSTALRAVGERQNPLRFDSFSTRRQKTIVIDEDPEEDSGRVGGDSLF